jgi:hypothetical protein
MREIVAKRLRGEIRNLTSVFTALQQGVSRDLPRQPSGEIYAINPCGAVGPCAYQSDVGLAAAYANR